MGPVNMMAIRRGVAEGWRHTAACAIGAIFADLALSSLAIFGGRYFLPSLSDPKVNTVLETVGAVILPLVGIYFLWLAVKYPRRPSAVLNGAGSRDRSKRVSSRKLPKLRL